MRLMQCEINPWTARSDYHVTSPNDIHTSSTKQVMRILRYEVEVDLTPNSLQGKYIAARGEN